MSISDVEVSEILDAWLQDMDSRRHEWADYRAAYMGQFWRHHGQWLRSARVPAAATQAGTQQDPLPIKVEVNLLRPHIDRLMAQLHAQRVRMQATPPVVVSTRPGRNRDMPAQASQAIAALVEDFLDRRDYKQQKEQAARMVAMYGCCALKHGLRPPEEHDQSPMDRIVVDVLPPWEAGWDPMVSSRSQRRYVFHWRQQDAQWIHANLGENISLEGIEPVALTDFLAEGTHGQAENRPDEAFYWVLEFYDLTCAERRYYLRTEASQQGGSLRRIFSEEMPYYAGSSIIPIVAQQVPEHPGRGLSIIDGLYQKAAERNLLLTVAANAFRTDAARKRLLRGDALDDEALSRLNDQYDSQWVVVQPGEGAQDQPWSDIFHSIETPRLPTTFGDYMSVLIGAQRDEQSSSTIQQGQQGSYLSANEAQLLAQYGEQNTGVLLSCIQEASSELAEDLLMVTAQQMEADNLASITVRLSGDVKLKRDVLSMRWRMRPAEAANSPARLAQQRVELLSAQPMLMELAVTASGGPPQPPPQPGPDGQPMPAPGPSTAPEVQMFAQRMFDWLGQSLGLPEDTRWRILEQDAAPKEPEEEPVREEDMRKLEQLLMPQQPPNPFEPDPMQQLAEEDEPLPEMPIMPGGPNAPA